MGRSAGTHVTTSGIMVAGSSSIQHAHTRGMNERRKHKLADTAQQLVGGFLLAGPFVVTEEVWSLAKSMNTIQGLLTVAVVFAIGYASLYKANDDRDVDAEQEVGGIPLRFISLMLVSFGSVTILALLFDAPDVFVGGSLLSLSTIEI